MKEYKFMILRIITKYNFINQRVNLPLNINTTSRNSIIIILTRTVWLQILLGLYNQTYLLYLKSPLKCMIVWEFCLIKEKEKKWKKMKLLVLKTNSEGWRWCWNCNSNKGTKLKSELYTNVKTAEKSNIYLFG